MDEENHRYNFQTLSEYKIDNHMKLTHKPERGWDSGHNILPDFHLQIIVSSINVANEKRSTEQSRSNDGDVHHHLQENEAVMADHLIHNLVYDS